MDALDGRKLSEDNLQLLRRLAHRLRKKNYIWEEIADILGLALPVVIGWGRRFGVGGKDETFTFHRADAAPDMESVAR